MHIPVLAEFSSSQLVTDPSGNYLDATVGLGGHAALILKLLNEKGTLTGLDVDEEALKIASVNLESYGQRVKLIKESYMNIPKLFPDNSLDGILFDFGVSSYQLDCQERGFSFRFDSPLDMRMDRSLPRTAADIVNEATPSELEEIFKKYGEFPGVFRMVEAIKKAREKERIGTTGQLSRIVEIAHLRRGRLNPATKVFQALRIAVNGELHQIETVLQSSWKLLKSAGRIIAISYHSGEDRLVKNAFRQLSSEGKLNILTKKPVMSGEDELTANRRARSAKLRMAERV